jgi:DNA-binding NtrC family response regulator
VRPLAAGKSRTDAPATSAAPPAASGDELTARRAPGQPVRVLLVDDEELVANMLRLGLERLGYQVTMQAGGPQGLAAFVEAPDGYDIVVSDQIMRGLTGVRLAREIHVLRPNVPVILVTGFRDSVADDRAAAAGVFEVLEKPLSHVDLGGAIIRALAASARREREERA